MVIKLSKVIDSGKICLWTMKVILEVLLSIFIIYFFLFKKELKRIINIKGQKYENKVAEIIIDNAFECSEEYVVKSSERYYQYYWRA